MARRLENGAIVDDTGQWYWNLKGWSPLVASPSGKAPGALLGKDRKDVAHLMKGIGLNVDAMSAIRVAGEHASRLVKELGSLDAAEAAMSPTTPLAGPPPEPQPTPVAPPAPSMPDRYAQLKELGELRAQGILTDEEFQKEKSTILGTR
ncbi:MAG: SHOCT domain-containing protein [Candidatus Dormibacteraceae bacterium]